MADGSWFEVYFPAKNWKLVRGLLWQMNYSLEAPPEPLVPHLPYWPLENFDNFETTPPELEPGQLPKVGGFVGRWSASNEIGEQPSNVRDYIFWSLPQLLDAMEANYKLKSAFGETQASWRTIAVYLNTRIAVVDTSPAEETIIVSLITPDGGLQSEELLTGSDFDSAMSEAQALGARFLAG